MSKSDFKENTCSSSINESFKRRKIEENKMSENSSKSELNEESESNLSVTIYEDDNDLSYFNKSTRKRLLSSSFSKRSPLATINKQEPLQPSTSTKTPSKLDDSYYRRLQMKNIANDPFSRLSDEIMLHIFQYLPKKALLRIATVNSRFSRIVLDETLWVRMDLGNRALRRGAIGKIFSRGLIILRLAQARIQSPIFESHFHIEGFQTKLQYLDLSMASINKSSLAQLISTCRLLKKLSLEQLALDDAVCLEIAENKNLEVLNLALCEGLTREGVQVISENLQYLTALNISWTQLSADAVSSLVINISPTILRLNLSGCRKTLNDEHIQILVSRCPNIVELDVSDCGVLSSVTINTISTLQHIEYLSLSRCYGIAMTSYLALNNAKSLLYLDVFGLLSDAGLQMLEKTFKNLGINKYIHSSVARPTVLPRRTSIWGLRTRD